VSADEDWFEGFVREVEPRLRAALVAVFGQERGRDATAAALAWGWEHLDRIKAMDNAAGYLYRVGRSSQRERKRPAFRPVPEDNLPDVEPGLPKALERLSEKQRIAVVLVHAYGWSRHEVAELVGVSVSTLDSHLARGLGKLRKSLGVMANV
jgi:DNA-directed RNA polymerase specialized sigma24 family protein